MADPTGFGPIGTDRGNTKTEEGEALALQADDTPVAVLGLQLIAGFGALGLIIW